MGQCYKAMVKNCSVYQKLDSCSKCKNGYGKSLYEGKTIC